MLIMVAQTASFIGGPVRVDVLTAVAAIGAYVIVGVLLGLGAAAVAASRIMLGVRCISDVVDGAALGVFCGVAVAAILLQGLAREQ